MIVESFLSTKKALDLKIQPKYNKKLEDYGGEDLHWCTYAFYSAFKMVYKSYRSKVVKKPIAKVISVSKKSVVDGLNTTSLK